MAKEVIIESTTTDRTIPVCKQNPPGGVELDVTGVTIDASNNIVTTGTITAASLSGNIPASDVDVTDADAVLTGTTAETTLVELAKRVLGTFATEAAIKAIPAAARTNGAIAVDATNDVLWVFDSGSAAGASAWVLVPDAGTGRWLRNHPSLADLAGVTATTGLHLLGYEDGGSFTTAADGDAALDEIYQHLRSIQHCIPFSLHAFREVDANGDVGNIVANGGLLASDTTPIFRADAAESEEISWATGNVDPVQLQTALPPNFDDTADAKFEIDVYSGATDASTLTIETSWDGGAKVSDTADDAATKSATRHTITATIANADIPAGARNVTIHIVPTNAHAVDAYQIVGARLLHKGKLLTS